MRSSQHTTKKEYNSFILFLIFAMANKLDDRIKKREKLCSFENLLLWANLSQAMLEKIKVWEVIDGTRVEPITVAQTRKREKNNALTFKIIKQGINSDLYTKIIQERNLKQC